MSVRDFNQSLTKKEAYAYAFASVLAEHGIKAHTSNHVWIKALAYSLACVGLCDML
jgi:hypothetical protein